MQEKLDDALDTNELRQADHVLDGSGSTWASVSGRFVVSNLIRNVLSAEERGDMMQLCVSAQERKFQDEAGDSWRQECYAACDAA